MSVDKNNVQCISFFRKAHPVHEVWMKSVSSRKILPYVPDRFLSKNGISTQIHYPFSVHNVPAFWKKLSRNIKYPNAEKLEKEIISIPFHQYMSRSQIKYIVQMLSKFYIH